MTMENNVPMQISERELTGMTAELVEMHEDTMPRYRAHLADLADGLRDELDRAARIVHINASRRHFLRGGLVTAGVLGGGAVLAACGSSDSSSGSAASGGSSSANNDVVVVKLAASLEVLAVNTYQAALSAAAAGSLGTVPPVIGSFATVAKKQHQDHLDAWNGVLGQASQPKVTDPNPKYNKIVMDALKSVKTVGDVGNLALTLETIAAQTYVSGASLVQSKAGRQTALTIAPVEWQHAVILMAVLGKQPDPTMAFIKTDMAATPDSLNG